MDEEIMIENLSKFMLLRGKEESQRGRFEPVLAEIFEEKDANGITKKDVRFLKAPTIFNKEQTYFLIGKRFRTENLLGAVYMNEGTMTMVDMKNNHLSPKELEEKYGKGEKVGTSKDIIILLLIERNDKDFSIRVKFSDDTIPTENSFVFNLEKQLRAGYNSENVISSIMENARRT